MPSKYISLLLLAALFLGSCQKEAVIPQNATPIKEVATLFPDYRDVTIPPNIAPLNFMVKDEGATEFVASVKGRTEIVAGAGDDGKVQFDSLEWRKLLEASKGTDLTVALYAHKGEGWVAYPEYKISVAAEPIDRYLSYRLIEPSYELYRQLGLYQRDLEGFTQYTIYENNRENDVEENHCINCHNFQNYDTDRMLFHVRAKHGGTVISRGNDVVKVGKGKGTDAPSMVYPTWHPTHDWIVFSTNKTGQAFHVTNPDKIEVVDYGSDLLFYDAEKNELRSICQTGDRFETFPCFSPDGRKLYYCSAYTPEFDGVADSVAVDLIVKLNDSIRYDIYSMTFDPATKQFGEPQLEVDCHSQLKSAAVPRVSPDGRYLLFTRGDYGQFHIWHHTADLWLKDLETGEVRSLDEVNSRDVDSYHSWSSNGRWMVFASRRLDGSYSRPFIAYFDVNGKARKPFLLPQEDPENSILLMKSYNVPELSKNRVRHTHEEFKKVVYDDAAMKPVKYVK